jgi:putative Mg2+ transporter-C (MgtC) family protein
MLSLPLASSVPSLSWGEVLLRVVVAAVLGGAIGVERELREREAGLRTHLLVCVGSALFTIVSAYGFRDFFTAGGNVSRIDPTRIAAQIVSGIGFLGAGAIIRQGLSVRGLTTAATLWVVAAIGLTAGAGYYSAAAITTAVALVSLWPLRLLAFRAIRRFRPESGRLLVQLSSGESPGPLITEVERLGARIESVAVSQEGDRRSIGLDLALPPDAVVPDLVAKVSDVEHVLEVRWAE